MFSDEISEQVALELPYSNRLNNMSNQFEAKYESYHTNVIEKYGIPGIFNTHFVGGEKDEKHYYRDGILTNVEGYRNGKIIYKIDVKNNIPNGAYVGEYYQGKPLVNGYYTDGKKSGEWKRLSISGKLVAYGNYIDGKKSGAWKRLSVTGKQLPSMNYVNGVLI